MKFTSTLEINAPIDFVVKLFSDPAHYKGWQQGFKSYEHISGVAGKEGAVSKVVFQNGKRRIEMKETIQKANLPGEIIAFYQHEHMENTMATSFAELPGSKTKFTVTVNYTKFIGIMPKIVSVLMSGMFKKQGQKWLENFKAFAERTYAQQSA